MLTNDEHDDKDADDNDDADDDGDGDYDASVPTCCATNTGSKPYIDKRINNVYAISGQTSQNITAIGHEARGEPVIMQWIATSAEIERGARGPKRI